MAVVAITNEIITIKATKQIMVTTIFSNCCWITSTIKISYHIMVKKVAEQFSK